MSQQANASLKIILIDDDPLFGRLMQRAAQNLELNLDFYESLSSLGFIGSLAQYDIIIVDNQMDNVSGIEVASYIPSFFTDKTIVLISSTDLAKDTSMQLPEYISEFIHKELGCDKVLEMAIAAR